jgi:hypothetical protein
MDVNTKEIAQRIKSGYHKESGMVLGRPGLGNCFLSCFISEIVSMYYFD